MKLNKFKIIIATIVIIILLFVVIACSIKLKEEKRLLTINFDTKETVLNILNNEDVKLSIDFSTLKEITVDEINNIFDIDSQIIEEFYGEIPTVSLSADEIIIVKVKDNSDIKNVEEKFKLRAKNIASNFKDYLEKEYVLASNPLIYSKGNYVIFAISDNNNKIKEIFEEKFK